MRSPGRTTLKTAAYSLLRVIDQFTLLQRTLFAAYIRLAPHQPRMKQHPFDSRWGADTSGCLPAWMLRPDGASADGDPYAGCHPACVRVALDAIPDHPSHVFVDLGCGKGRAMVVASEFPFKQVVGVELSPQLAQIANRNAQVIFVHENPVCAPVLDAAPAFSRWFAQNVPCEAHERGFAAGDEESVVIWRAGGPPRTPHGNAQAAVAADAKGHAVVAAAPGPPPAGRALGAG